MYDLKYREKNMEQDDLWFEVKINQTGSGTLGCMFWCVLCQRKWDLKFKEKCELRFKENYDFKTEENENRSSAPPLVSKAAGCIL